MPSTQMPRCGPAQVFWGEIAPCEHLLQIYGDDAAFLDALERFVATGLEAGESVVVIATEVHRHGLAARLRQRRIDLAAAIAENRFMPLDADETLRTFMRKDWPDEALFEAAVSRILAQIRVGGRRARAFGEMVAILWAKGNAGATVRLEHLWNGLMRREQFGLFCAYPKSGFTRDARESMEAICAAHSRVFGLEDVISGAA